MSKKIVSDASNDSTQQKSSKPLSINDKNVTLVHRDFKGLLIGSNKSAAASAIFGQKK